MRLLGLPDALRDFGVEPVLVAGWETRGNEFDQTPRLHLRHWTAGPTKGRIPSLRTVTLGRPDLPGPLAQVLQSRESSTGLDKAYVIASGIANHAGAGSWPKGDGAFTSGNRQGTGNEIEWSGPGESFGSNRIETSERIAAAFQSLHPNPWGSFCCEHREYAEPAGRKIDTNLNGNTFRVRVQTLLTKPTTEPTTEPIIEPIIEPNHEEVPEMFIMTCPGKPTRLVDGPTCPVIGVKTAIRATAAKVITIEHEPEDYDARINHHVESLGRHIVAAIKGG